MNVIGGLTMVAWGSADLVLGTPVQGLLLILGGAVAVSQGA